MVGGFVYTARDVAGCVLYVGVTEDVRRRLAEHQRSSPWWGLHAQIDVDEFDTMAEAKAAEDDGICRYDPPYNIRGGHGCASADCSGRRCERVRAETTRLC